MKSSTCLLASMLAVTLLPGVASDRVEESIQLLPAESVYYDYIAELPTHDWLELRQSGDQSMLRPVDADSLSTAERVAENLRTISILREDAHRVALVSTSHLQAGEVPGAQILPGQSWLGQQIIEMNGSRHSFSLSPSCNPAAHEFADCAWVLSDGIREQVMFEQAGVFWGITQKLEIRHGAVELLWAGDLDRDGRLDLIIQMIDNQGHAMGMKLFLSSRAAQGELLGLAGEYETGC